MEYPRACQAVDEDNNTCVTFGDDYLPSIDPMTIFVNSVTSYTVTGAADNLQKDQRVYWKGIRSGEVATAINDVSRHATINSMPVVVMALNSPFSVVGDSGGPVYVKGSNNEVEIVGIISANNRADNEVIVVPSTEIQKDLGLRPVS